MKNYLPIGTLLAITAAALLGGCRGIESDNRPIHLNPNMDEQGRYDPQEVNTFFENNMAMRPPVPGTVAKGFLREDVRFYSGQTEAGNYVDKVPVPVTQALLERGRERYNIFCSVCHGRAGFGQGVIMEGDYGYTPAPTYHKEALRDTADGYLYEVITNGVRNMPGYAAQVPVADRWAIVAYIRALQRSQNAQRENVPPSVLARIEQTGSANMNAARNPTPPATGGGGGASEGTDGDGGTTDGGTTDGETPEADAQQEEGSETSTEDAPEEASADTAAAQQQPTATAEDAPASSDTAAAAPATASTDTAAGVTAGDTASTTVAEGANVTETTPADEGQGDVASGGVEGSGTFFGSTFFVFLLVVLPILALTAMLVVAFRKDRDH